MAIEKINSPIKKVIKIPNRDLYVIICIILLFISTPSYGKEPEIPLIPDTCTIHWTNNYGVSDTWFVKNGIVTASKDTTIPAKSGPNFQTEPNYQHEETNGKVSGNTITGVMRFTYGKYAHTFTSGDSLCKEIRWGDITYSFVSEFFPNYTFHSSVTYQEGLMYTDRQGNCASTGYESGLQQEIPPTETTIYTGTWSLGDISEVTPSDNPWCTKKISAMRIQSF